MRLVVSTLLALFLALPVAARPLDGAESRALGKAVDIYLRAIGRGDADRMVSSIPPRVLNVFAGQAGIEAKSLNKVLADQTRAMIKGAKFTDLTSDRSALDARDETMPDGSRVTWVVIPTAFTAQTKAGKTRNEQPLLAIREGSKWYMMRMEGEQQQQLAGFAYPFLKGVQMPASRSTPLK